MFKKLFLGLVFVFGMALAFASSPASAQCSPDTIVCREDPTDPDNGNGNGDLVPIELVSLCLKSVDPVSIPFGLSDCEDDILLSIQIDLDQITPPEADQTPFLLEIEDVFTIRGRGTIPSNRGGGK